MVKRYIKPSWFFARIFNRIALATGAVNSEPMTVIKRRSKLPQTIPMTPVYVDGVKYVVPVRGETEWVKNVRQLAHQAPQVGRDRLRGHRDTGRSAETDTRGLQRHGQQGDPQIVSAAARRRRPPSVCAHATFAAERQDVATS
jgi:hypothetical protein